MRDFILEHWIEITVGLGLTVVASMVMSGARGYFALGGEWLIAPFFVFVGYLVKRFVENDLPWVMEIILAPNDEEDEEDWEC